MLATLLAEIVIDHYSYRPVFWGLGLLPVCSGLCALLALGGGRDGDSTIPVSWERSWQAIQD